MPTQAMKRSKRVAKMAKIKFLPKTSQALLEKYACTDTAMQAANPHQQVLEQNTVSHTS